MSEEEEEDRSMARRLTGINLRQLYYQIRRNIQTGIREPTERDKSGVRFIGEPNDKRMGYILKDLIENIANALFYEKYGFTPHPGEHKLEMGKLGLSARGRFVSVDEFNQLISDIGVISTKLAKKIATGAKPVRCDELGDMDIVDMPTVLDMGVKDALLARCEITDRNSFVSDFHGLELSSVGRSAIQDRLAMQELATEKEWMKWYIENIGSIDISHGWKYLYYLPEKVYCEDKEIMTKMKQCEYNPNIMNGLTTEDYNRPEVYEMIRKNNHCRHLKQLIKKCEVKTKEGSSLLL